MAAVEVRESSRKWGEQVGRTVGELVGMRWVRTDPAPEQPLELPVPVLAHSARDRLIPPNTSTYQYYSLVPVLTRGTFVFPKNTLVH